MTAGSAPAPPRPLPGAAARCLLPGLRRAGPASVPTLRAPSPPPLPGRGKAKPKRPFHSAPAGRVHRGRDRPAAERGAASTRPRVPGLPAAYCGCGGGGGAPPSFPLPPPAARPVSGAQDGQVLLLRGGDAVPAPAGDQRHAAGGQSLPEGRGPGDREGEACVCVCERERRRSSAGGTLPPHSPLLNLVRGGSVPGQTLWTRALLLPSPSRGGLERVKEGWRGMALTVFLLE